MTEKQKYTFKDAVQIAGGVVGLVVALFALWHLISPKGSLIAEVTGVEVHRREEQPKGLAEVPDDAAKELRARLDAVSTLTSEQRQSIVAADTLYLRDRLEDFYQLLLPDAFITIVSVRNATDSTLRDVTFRFTGLAPSYVLLQSDVVPSKALQPARSLVLGDLPPLSEVHLEIWSHLPLMFSDNAVITHHDGVGSVFYSRPVPAIVVSGGGTWISYKWFTIVFLAVIAVSLVVYLVIRWRLQPRNVTPSGA